MIEMPRRVYSELFSQVLGDAYSIGEMDVEPFANQTFEIHPYNDDEEQEYNFHHIPSGFKMRWYKYPLRSPEWNMVLTPDEFNCMLYDCLNSLYENIKFDFYHEKWWEQ